MSDAPEAAAAAAAPVLGALLLGTIESGPSTAMAGGGLVEERSLGDEAGQIVQCIKNDEDDARLY